MPCNTVRDASRHNVEGIVYSLNRHRLLSKQASARQSAGLSLRYSPLRRRLSADSCVYFGNLCTFAGANRNENETENCCYPFMVCRWGTGRQRAEHGREYPQGVSGRPRGHGQDAARFRGLLSHAARVFRSERGAEPASHGPSQRARPHVLRRVGTRGGGQSLSASLSALCHSQIQFRRP